MGDLSPFADLFHDAWHTRSWKEKFALWFRHTGYRPADVAPPSEMPDIHAYENYDPFVGKGVKIYAGVQYALLLVATTALVGISHTTTYGFHALWACVLAMNLMIVGRQLEGQGNIVASEAFRFLIVGGALVVSESLWSVFSLWHWWFVAGWGLASVMGLFILPFSYGGLKTAGNDGS